MAPPNFTQDTQTHELFHVLVLHLANPIHKPQQPLRPVQSSPGSPSTLESQPVILAIQRFQSLRAFLEAQDLKAMLRTWTTWLDWQKHSRDCRLILPLGKALEDPHRVP